MNTAGLIIKYVKTVFPKVNSQLQVWENKSYAIESRVLRDLALSSITKKKFHCQGGGFYAMYPGAKLDNTVKFIVAFQTICDYLDNLCDMAGVYDETAFRQLHLAISDAVALDSKVHDYYKYYPYKNDSDYLVSLVRACKEEIMELKSYHIIAKSLNKYVQLYTDLQSLKHLAPDLRESKLINWTTLQENEDLDIYWWEFSAISGSTLLIFYLFAAGFRPITKEELKLFNSAYFPWVCGLHILLDYYIDFEEDQLANELNFCNYYSGLKHCQNRLALFIENSFKSCQALKYPEFHKTIINGLLAMYLSDSKAFNGKNNSTTTYLLTRGELRAELYHFICKILRKFKRL